MKIEYEIIDVDWFEQDASLQIEDERFYFQWDAKEEPTILDALRFWKQDSKFFNGG